MKHFGARLGVFALLAFFLMATAASADEIVVSAAASLTNAMSAVKKNFEHDHPGIKVAVNFASSGKLLKQMEQGAPVDVFCSADEKTMDDAVAKGLMDKATRRNFVKNAMVLIVPADSTLGIRSERDLLSPKVKRVSLGNPDTVPAGRYARGFLQGARLWAPLKNKYAFGESVRQVLDYVVRGEVDAGFVFATDAFQAGMKAHVVKQIPLKRSPLYPVALTRSGAGKKSAKIFENYLLSPAGQMTLHNFGFMKP